MRCLSRSGVLPAALDTEGMSPVLGCRMFIIGLLGYFGLDRLLPRIHRGIWCKRRQRFSRLDKTHWVLLTLGISLHNFPEGIATFVTAGSNLELGFGIALAVALLYSWSGGCRSGLCRDGLKRTAIFGPVSPAWRKILGGVLACWLIFGRSGFANRYGGYHGGGRRHYGGALRR